jgi:signal transduction histidine kinase
MNVVVGLEWFFTIVGAQISIFFFDVTTREDDVSVGFLYTLPTLMGFFVKDRLLQTAIVGISVVLIMVGCFIPVPVRDDLLVFIANRILSVVMVLVTGVMVYYRMKLEYALGDALAKEKSASATQRAFVSMVSHEFRTPLTIIDGEAYRLIRLKDQIAPEDLERRAKSIRFSVTRMINLIEGVLYSSRAQENKIVLNVEQVNLRSLIRGVCHQQSRVSGEHFIEYTVADLPLMIRADRNLLTYVFDNLLSNAVKYSPVGTTVKVIGHTADGFAVISVRDRGIGIPADDLPKLFEPYFRAGNASGFAGSGVGLYIVQTFIRLHGGRVTVDSVLGRGSVFTVYLPVTGPEDS